MKPFSEIVDDIVNFVVRNPLLCIFFMLVIISPALLKHMLIIFVVLGVMLLGAVLCIAWRIHRLRRRVERSFEEAQRFYDYDGEPSPEGEVKVHRTQQAPRKKVKDDVGEYVDFEEEK